MPDGARTHAIERGERGIPVALIRGGTSRGIYLREQDLAPGWHERRAQILRMFGGHDGLVADGLGGDLPTQRKVALINSLGRGPDNIPILSCACGQVDLGRTTIDFSCECGNIAAGVPLFASQHGWCGPLSSDGQAWLHLTNTGQRVLARWRGGDVDRRAVELVFIDPASHGVSAALPLGAPTSSVGLPAVPELRCTVVRAINTYVFVDSGDLGIADPIGAEPTPEVYDALESLVEILRPRLPLTSVLKVCIVAPADDRGGMVRARMVYPGERKSHPAFAVSGGVTLAVAASLPGTLLHGRLAAMKTDGRITIEHPTGALDVRCVLRPDGLPTRASVVCTSRLLLRGLAY
jgi:2-methylaconitate cis-trans-isomerase PrpF